MAATVPAMLLNDVRTDADWVQDLEFTDDGVDHDFGEATFSLTLVPTSAAHKDEGFTLDTAGGTIELQGARVCIRVPAADMADRYAGAYRWALREHREDGGVIALAVGEVTINRGLSDAVDGDPIIRSGPVSGLGGTVTINTPPAGPVSVVRGLGGPVGRSALQHLIANGTLPVGATEADFEAWLVLRAHEAVEDFTHTQTVAADAWTINHNLGVRPMTAVLDAAGREVTAEVEHVSVNQLQVRFAAPQTGSVRCL